MIGKTRRDYPVYEVAVFVSDFTDDSGGERLKEGDIVEIRPVTNGIGLGESRNYLWLLITGLEKDSMDRLSIPVTDPPDFLDRDVGMDTPSPVIYDKRRYCIPLDRLNQVFPLNLSRARDTSDDYQPFRLIDKDKRGAQNLDYGLWIGEQSTPLDVSGLVFDKVTGQYIG